MKKVWCLAIGIFLIINLGFVDSIFAVQCTTHKDCPSENPLCDGKGNCVGCIDTDKIDNQGINPFNKGKVLSILTLINNRPLAGWSEDTCDNLYTLNEAYCEDNKLLRTSVNCWEYGMACVDGSCRVTA